MNNRIKIILVAVLLMALVYGADRVLKMQEGNYIKDDISNNSGENINVSKVLEVTAESFDLEVLQSEKVVLIDFYATWCNPCKILSPTIEEIAKERDDIKVVKIDVDKEPEIANKYGIMSLPTIVVIEGGVEKNRAIGVISKEAIENMVAVQP